MTEFIPSEKSKWLLNSSDQAFQPDARLSLAHLRRAAHFAQEIEANPSTSFVESSDRLLKEAVTQLRRKKLQPKKKKKPVVFSLMQMLTLEKTRKQLACLIRA